MSGAKAAPVNMKEYTKLAIQRSDTTMTHVPSEPVPSTIAVTVHGLCILVFTERLVGSLEMGEDICDIEVF